MGSRAGGWTRRRLRGLLLILPPRARGAIARAGWRFSERSLARKALIRDAEWAATITDPPLPPASLRSLVGKRSDAEHFLATGRDNYELIRSLLRSAGAKPGGRILDFGCGCGRIARWWPDSAAIDLYGCDLNGDLAGWCDQNLPMSASSNEELPPTPYEDEQFDLVYSFSVFTHLAPEAQDAWLAELHRILKPGGLLFFTVNGADRASRLPRRQMADFVLGEPITLFEESAGSNLCAAYRPADYVEGHMLSRFEPVASLPAHDLASPIEQDCYLARKPLANRRNGASLALVADRQ